MRQVHVVAVELQAPLTPGVKEEGHIVAVQTRFKY